MPYDGGDLTCVSCLNLSPGYDKGRSALQYEGLARDLVLRLKHGDATYLPASLSTWMMHAGYELWADTDYLIPVPLHRWRLFRRGYNQATLLARSLSKRIQIPLLTNTVIRKKATGSQGFKTRKQRYENVQGAFALKDPNGLLKDKTITLIDDVWTTGATMAACIKVLKQGGVKKVYVLTLARVVKES